MAKTKQEAADIGLDPTSHCDPQDHQSFGGSGVGHLWLRCGGLLPLLP